MSWAVLPLERILVLQKIEPQLVVLLAVSCPMTLSNRLPCAFLEVTGPKARLDHNREK